MILLKIVRIELARTCSSAVKVKSEWRTHFVCRKRFAIPSRLPEPRQSFFVLARSNDQSAQKRSYWEAVWLTSASITQKRFPSGSARTT